MKTFKFPETRQISIWDCGASAMQSVLYYYGFDVGEDTLIKLAGTNKKTGTSIAGLKKIAKKYGLVFTAGEKTIVELKKYINKKIPVVLLLKAWPEKKVDWTKDLVEGHYVTAIGYDRQNIYFEDPYKFVRTYLSFKELEIRWHSMDEGKRYVKWGMAVLGRKDGKKKNLLSAKPIHMD
jgi:ABC-type bacteriocin/lantibiotic exporter with double-glycine peptidase domain